MNKGSDLKRKRFLKSDSIEFDSQLAGNSNMTIRNLLLIFWSIFFNDGCVRLTQKDLNNIGKGFPLLVTAEKFFILPLHLCNSLLHLYLTNSFLVTRWYHLWTWVLMMYKAILCWVCMEAIGFIIILQFVNSTHQTWECTIWTSGERKWEGKILILWNTTQIT